jgi:hypothetical protein
MDKKKGRKIDWSVVTLLVLVFLVSALTIYYIIS